MEPSEMTYLVRTDTSPEDDTRFLLELNGTKARIDRALSAIWQAIADAMGEPEVQAEMQSLMSAVDTTPVITALVDWHLQNFTRSEIRAMIAEGESELSRKRRRLEPSLEAAMKSAMDDLGKTLVAQSSDSGSTDSSTDRAGARSASANSASSPANS